MMQAIDRTESVRKSKHEGVRVLREMGLESQDIADRIGVSRATVKAYLREMGIAPVMPTMVGYKRRRDSVVPEVRQLRLKYPRMSMVKIASIVWVSHQRVKQILDKAGLRASMVPVPRPTCIYCGKEKPSGSTPYTDNTCGSCKSAGRLVELTCHSCGQPFLRRDYELTNQARLRQRRGLPPQKRWFCTRKCMGSVLGKEHGVENLRNLRTTNKPT